VTKPSFAARARIYDRAFISRFGSSKLTAWSARSAACLKKSDLAVAA
jgi:hypothetical protein